MTIFRVKPSLRMVRHALLLLSSLDLSGGHSGRCWNQSGGGWAWSGGFRVFRPDRLVDRPRPERGEMADALARFEAPDSSDGQVRVCEPPIGSR